MQDQPSQPQLNLSRSLFFTATADTQPHLLPELAAAGLLAAAADVAAAGGAAAGARAAGAWAKGAGACGARTGEAEP